MLAKTFAGLEDVLFEELQEIGAKDLEKVVRGVKFTGDNATLYKANFCCRTALRVLKNLNEFEVKDANDLYKQVSKINWTDIFDIKSTFAVNSTVNSDAFNNSMFVSLKTKDAIVDQFREKFNKRPSINTETPDIRINVHVTSNKVTISLDSSGESLHKRGYRVGQNEASMSEVLAAGILKIAGWKGQCDLYDPMCGSGTLSVEAALIARNIPPGMFRSNFAFENWKDFDEDLFDEIYNEDYEKEFEHKIYASDIVPFNVRLTSEHIKNAGIKKNVEVQVADFAQLKPTSKGFLVMNPPYGERMNDRAIEPIYEMIGNQLKHSFIGFKAFVFSSSKDGFKKLSLKPSEKIRLFNGPLECELRKYEVYEGSKKASKQIGGRRSMPPTERRVEYGRKSDSPNRSPNPKGSYTAKRPDKFSTQKDGASPTRRPRRPRD